MRKPLQGVSNIILFNWHFYVIALILVLLLVLFASYLGEALQPYLYLIAGLVTGTTFISLLASLYVYDLSGLYGLKWIEAKQQDGLIVNINAGFDETSALLQAKFKNTELIPMDFYDPAKHTEVSISRARKAYPPYPNTRQVITHELPLENESADKVLVMLAAHEIRDQQERALFFSELNRIIKPTGQIYVTEHLRDVPNFMAYNIGFLHFYSRASWLRTFESANLVLQQELKITPFISTFILSKHGDTL